MAVSRRRKAGGAGFMMINRVKRQMDLGFPVWEFFVNGFFYGIGASVTFVQVLTCAE